MTDTPTDPNTEVSIPYLSLVHSLLQTAPPWIPDVLCLNRTHPQPPIRHIQSTLDYLMRHLIVYLQYSGAESQGSYLTRGMSLQRNVPFVPSSLGQAVTDSPHPSVVIKCLTNRLTPQPSNWAAITLTRASQTNPTRFTGSRVIPPGRGRDTSHEVNRNALCAHSQKNK